MTVKNDFFSAIGVVAIAAFFGVLAWKIIDSAANPVAPPHELAEIHSTEPAIAPPLGEPATTVSHQTEFVPNIRWDASEGQSSAAQIPLAPMPPASTANPSSRFLGHERQLPAESTAPNSAPTIAVPEPPRVASTEPSPHAPFTTRTQATRTPATARPAVTRYPLAIPSEPATPIAQFEGIPVDTRFYPVTNANLPQRLPVPSGVELTSTYDNSIKPDEDLLLAPGESVAAPETVSPPAGKQPPVEQPVAQQPPVEQPQPPVEQPVVQQQPAQVQQPKSIQPEPIQEPITPQVVQTPAENISPPATSTGPYRNLVQDDEDLLTSAGEAQQPVRVQPQAPPAQAPAQQPVVQKQQPQTVVQQQPTVVQQQPTANMAAPQATTSPSNPGRGGWSNTVSPDEDLLTGVAAPSTPQNPTPAMPQPAQETLPEPNAPAAQAPRTTQPSPRQLSPEEDLLGPARPATRKPTPPQTQTPTTPKQPTPPPKTLVTPGSNPHGNETPKRTGLKPGEDPHLAMYQKNPFPSAKECRACHEKIYEEWASSSHAYASMSSMFNKFEQHIHGLTQGTISAFCLRCHSPLATTLGHPRESSVFESIPAAKEGVTCVVCHRVNEEYGKVNGERRVLMGDIHDPVYGAGYGEELQKVLAKKQFYKVKERGDTGPGQKVHGRVINFEQISSSHFCVSCHQVAVKPGIALEVVWAQYRQSPACKAGVTCQDCHMGAEPGVNAGYETAPVAIVNGKEISPNRKHSNHLFYGPGYSIAHPGLFPFHKDAEDWTMQEWMEFDWRAGWGTEAFEEALDDGKINAAFPEAWSNADDRADARDVVDDNLKKLEAKRRMRHRLMENGSHLEGPIFGHNPKAGRTLRFHYKVNSTNSGHNIPSGSLGAQPQCWLNVALTGPNGEHLWESGYVDANGDIADVHSLEVAAGRIKRDVQLFNLQTKFLITGVKGTDREMSLPVNADFDQLPFIRASGFPVTVMNHPPFIRMEAHSIPPLGHKNARYKIPGNLLKTPGVYRLSARMRFRAEPIYFMKQVNATAEMIRSMNEWMLDFHEQSYEFVVD